LLDLPFALVFIQFQSHIEAGAGFGVHLVDYEALRKSARFHMSAKSNATTMNFKRT